MAQGCTHGMPTPAACFECMEEGVLPPPPPPRPAKEAEGDPFPARYDTRCRGCNTEIHVGELIVRTTHGTYEHAAHFDVGPATTRGWSTT